MYMYMLHLQHHGDQFIADSNDIYVHSRYIHVHVCILQGAEPSLDFQQAVMACQKTALNPDDFSCIQLVYGNAGELL